MRQILFYIPLDRPWSMGPLGEVPVFGFGVLFWVWMLFGAWWAFRHWRDRSGMNMESATSAAIWLAVAVAIQQLPRFAARIVPDGIPIYGFGFMLVVGFGMAGWFAARRAPRAGIPSDAIWDVAMWVFFAGIAGARLFYVVQYHDRVFAGKQGLQLVKAAINLPDGGLVLYGGVILGAIAYLVVCHRMKLNPLLVADIIVPSMFIGLAFGRLGCLLNGCCYGDACSLPWAITFPRGSIPFNVLVAGGVLSPDAVRSLPLHPTQIYSSINAFTIAAVTAMYFRYRQRNGDVLLVGWLLYPITRFVIEFLRNDEPGQFGTRFTIAQWVSGGMFIAAIVYWLWLSRQPTLDGRRATRTPPTSAEKPIPATSTRSPVR